MTVKYVTHSLNTGEITVLGQIQDMAIVQGQTISRLGAVEGQEQQNPPTIHVNLRKKQGATPDDMLVLMMGLQDAIELGLQLVAMGVENQPSPNVDEVRARLSQLIQELDQTLQVTCG